MCRAAALYLSLTCSCGCVLLLNCVACVSTGDVAGVWYVLSSLPSVPRFPLVASFLSAKDKQSKPIPHALHTLRISRMVQITHHDPLVPLGLCL